MKKDHFMGASTHVSYDLYYSVILLQLGSFLLLFVE